MTISYWLFVFSISPIQRIQHITLLATKFVRCQKWARLIGPKLRHFCASTFMGMQDIWIPKPWLIIFNYLKKDDNWACSTVQTGLVSISLGRAITGLWYLDLKMWSLEASWKISLARLSCPLLNNVLPKLFISWDNLAASIPSLSIDLKSRLPSFFLPRLFITIPL